MQHDHCHQPGMQQGRINIGGACVDAKDHLLCTSNVSKRGPLARSMYRPVGT